MKLRNAFSVVGPFLLAFGPLTVAVGSRFVQSEESQPGWPSGVVAIAGQRDDLGGVRVLDPTDDRVIRVPVDLVVQPPDHGDIRLETLFATGKINEIRTGLERTLRMSIPFVLVLNPSGDVVHDNLGEHLGEARAQLSAIDPEVLETRRIARADGTYSIALGDPLALRAAGDGVDLSRVVVRVLHGPDRPALAAAIERSLLGAGFESVTVTETDDDLPASIRVLYRLDPVLGDLVAAAIGENATVQAATDLSRLDGADVAILIG